MALTAYAGFPPSAKALTLMYQMTDYKDERAQGIALGALARLKPLPSEAKALLFGRMIETGTKMPVPQILDILTYAVHDPDVLSIFLKVAEGDNVNAQIRATDVLSRMDPIPQQAEVVFRRLQKRSDLDGTVAAHVSVAIDRIEHRPSIH